MKKFLILLIFFICGNAFLPAFCQSEFNLVPKLGYSASTYVLNFPSVQHRMRSGLNGGVYFQYKRNEKFIIETGLQITSKGSIQNSFDTFPRLELVTTYADFPLLVGFQPTVEFFQIKGGLQFSNILGAYGRSDGNVTENKEFYNDWDVAFLIETTYEFDFGLNITVRFCNGITNMRRETTLFQNNVFVDDFRSFNVQMLVGYTLPILR